jgi:hypothetical protein
VKPNPTLTALLEAARNHEMTPEERREQRISFVYGNLAIDDPSVTKEHVREADREMNGPVVRVVQAFAWPPDAFDTSDSAGITASTVK